MEFSILVLQSLDLIVILAHEKLELLHALRSKVSGYILYMTAGMNDTCWYSATVAPFSDT